MREIILEGSLLLEKETAQEYLQTRFAFPEYYGKNLDALYDCLTEMEECEIEIKVPEQKTVYFERILRVFRAAARENGEIKVKMLQ